MGKARICSLLCAVAVAATLIGINPKAQADATFVGGGAAMVQLVAYQRWSSDLARVTGIRGVEAIQAMPSVELPWYGGSESASLAPTPKTPIAGVTIEGGTVRTRGNLQGYPYAESSANLGLALTGTDFVGVRTRCLWDRKTTFASTEIIRQGGKDTWRPGVNTRVDLPGLGYAVVNEHQRTTLWNGAKVIWVNGIHLYLTEDLGRLYGVTDIVLGFASCDPLNVPAIGSVRLVPNVSDSA